MLSERLYAYNVILKKTIQMPSFNNLFLAINNNILQEKAKQEAKEKKVIFESVYILEIFNNFKARN